jgi:hypothetical protein
LTAAVDERAPTSPPTEEDTFMRIAALIAATAVALALTACNSTEEVAADGPATEAAEASGVAEDASTMTADESAAAAAAAANAAYSPGGGETAPHGSPAPDAAPRDAAPAH